MQTSYSTATKHTATRAAHWQERRQDWRESEPYLELDDCTISADEAPSPCPAGSKQVVGGIVERRGVVVVVPSPWISKGVNGKAKAFWLAHGFEMRAAADSPHFVENYVVEFVRFCDVPMRGQRYSARAWLKWATDKYKELYLCKK